MSADRTIELVKTCSACPEQYDAYLNGGRVGYLRLRHGIFTVHFPDSSGDQIYSAAPNGDGEFENGERDHYLRFAVAAILHWVDNGAPAKVPEVKYKIREPLE